MKPSNFIKSSEKSILTEDVATCTKQVATSVKPSIIRSKYSILDTAETGFGAGNKLIKDCPKPEYKTHLFRENYLGEFKTETEKTLVRNNLGIYSKQEVDKIVSHIIVAEITNLVTKEELRQELDDLDFTDSVHKSYADYEIPNNLFK